MLHSEDHLVKTFTRHCLFMILHKVFQASLRVVLSKFIALALQLRYLWVCRKYAKERARDVKIIMTGDKVKICKPAVITFLHLLSRELSRKTEETQQKHQIL